MTMVVPPAVIVVVVVNDVAGSERLWCCSTLLLGDLVPVTTRLKFLLRDGDLSRGGPRSDHGERDLERDELLQL